jgi:hypothetical protein
VIILTFRAQMHTARTESRCVGRGLPFGSASASFPGFVCPLRVRRACCPGIYPNTGPKWRCDASPASAGQSSTNRVICMRPLGNRRRCHPYQITRLDAVEEICDSRPASTRNPPQPLRFTYGVPSRLQNMDPRQVTLSQAGQALPCITRQSTRHLHETSRLAAAEYVWTFAALTASPQARSHYDRRGVAGNGHPQLCATSSIASSANCITALRLVKITIPRRHSSSPNPLCCPAPRRTVTTAYGVDP